MAFSSTITRQIIVGNVRLNFGTWSSGATTGGDINTGLAYVDNITLTPKGSSVTTNATVVNETNPGGPAAQTIVTDSGVDGYWMAVGPR